MQGKFITIEGPDGAGKTTLVGNLAQRLTREGYQVMVTREPGGRMLGEAVRRILLDPAQTGMDPRTEALLYAAARAQHVGEVIAPALKAGKVVLCDRFLDSSIAYQGYGRGLTAEVIRLINGPGVGTVQPDLTILLDCDPEIGLNRTLRRGPQGADRLEQEKIEFHRLVREGFRQLAIMEPARIKLVEADGLPDEITARAWQHLSKILMGQLNYG